MKTDKSQQHDQLTTLFLLYKWSLYRGSSVTVFDFSIYNSRSVTVVLK